MLVRSANCRRTTESAAATAGRQFESRTGTHEPSAEPDRLFTVIDAHPFAICGGAPALGLSSTRTPCTASSSPLRLVPRAAISKVPYSTLGHFDRSLPAISVHSAS